MNKMNFIFLTSEGYTEDNSNENSNNLQVVGIAEGSNPKEAYETLLEEEWIKKQDFDIIFTFALADNYNSLENNKSFSLKGN